MARYITTLIAGTAHMHLCHQGPHVFGSTSYMTGGPHVAGVIYRQGQFYDAEQPRQILAPDELHRRLMAPQVSRLQVWVHGLKELAQVWSLPFRKGRERRWNPLLG